MLSSRMKENNYIEVTIKGGEIKVLEEFSMLVKTLKNTFTERHKDKELAVALVNSAVSVGLSEEANND